jgi:hypothetical protein
MKSKIAILALCLALVGGCTFLGVVQTVDTILCSWSPAEQTEAEAAEAYLESALGLNLPDNVSLEVSKAIIFANMIRQGVCLALSQLKSMLATVDQIQAVVQGQEAIKMPLMVKQAEYPNLANLRKRAQ